MVVAIEAKDAAKIKEAAGGIIERHGRTIYASLAALQAAKVYHDSGDLNGAKARCTGSSRNRAGRNSSPLRACGWQACCWMKRHFDEALKVVSADVPPSHAAAIADRRGDVFLA